MDGLHSASTSDKIKHRRRIVDMLLSMHSHLRDRYSRRGLWLDVAILAGSVVLCTVTFLDPALLRWAGVSKESFRLVAGAVSALLFILSLVMLRVDWKEAAGRHARAVALLGELKERGRAARGNDPDDSAVFDFIRAYDAVMKTVPPVPDHEFPKLKAYHLRKRALSEALDDAPHTPMWLLKLRLMGRDSRSALSSSGPGSSLTTGNKGSDATPGAR